MGSRNRRSEVRILSGALEESQFWRGFQATGERQQVATVMVLPLEPTDVPGVYRRGSKFVVVYRVEGRQRKQSFDTLADARAIKLERDGEARARRRGPT